MASFSVIIPELFIAVVAMLLLLLCAYSRFAQEKLQPLMSHVSLLALLLAGYQLLEQYGDVTVAFNGMFIADDFSLFMKLVILLASFLVLVLSFDLGSGKHAVPHEYPVLILLAVVGMMLMVSSNDLISLYLALELQSLCLYVLTAIRRQDDRASEAGLKYFMLGALASGLLLFGASLVYGFSGTTNFTLLKDMFAATEASQNVGVLFGLILVLVGIFFKLSAVPFHMWTPDVYEGSFKTVTAFFATAPKVAALGLLIRLLHQPFGSMAEDWGQILIVVSVLSMLVGAFGALRQQNIKRLLAYSSIGHVGYLLVGLAVGSEQGVHAALIYILLYVIMSVGVFACIMLMKRHDVHVENIGELSGLARNNPAFALALSILMFSMAGVPPMAGFWGKFFIFKAVVAEGYFTLAVIGVLSSVIAAYYYLRIVKVMYFDEPNEALDKDYGVSTAFLIAACGLFNVLFSLMPSPLFDVTARAAQALF